MSTEETPQDEHPFGPSIRSQFKLLTLGIILITVLLSSVLTFLLQRRWMQYLQIEDARSSAQVMSEQASIGLQFNDLELLAEITGTVRWKNGIRSAVIFDRDLKFLASYPPEPERLENLDLLVESLDPDRKEGYHLENFFIHPLLGPDGVQGFLGFEYNDEVLNSNLKNQFKALLITLAFVPLVVSLLIRPWRETLIQPIADLSTISRKILNHYDFSLRAKTDRKDELGKMVHYFNRMMDMIQERDRMLQEAKVILVDKVEERTLLLNTLNHKLQGELENRKVISDRLLEAKEKAEASDVAKSEFLSVVSHEVRTPISGIFGMVQLLQKTPLTDVQREYLDQIASASTRQLRLINNILDLTKMEVGEFTIQAEPTDLRALIEDTARQQAATVSHKGLDFLIDHDPNQTDLITVDGHALQQILSNLLGNSTKFTEEGSISIEVNVESNDIDNSGTLIMKVKDTGIGIDPDTLEELFEKFTQADSTTSRNYGGTGLGLAICKNLSEMMGGTIQGESRPGEGTHFIVNLPVEIPEGADENLPPDHPPIKVWLVTPSLGLQHVLQKHLQWLDIEVHMLSKTFLESNRQDAYVFLDTHGRSIDESQLENIRAAQTSCSAKVVFLTEYDAKDQPFMSDFPDHQTLRRPLIQLEALLKIFGITLPERDASVVKSIQNSILNHSGKNSPHLPSFGLKVLLVEDDEVNRLFMSTMVQYHTGDCWQASNGQEAIDMLRDGLEVDLILMDCMMPKMDGYQATEWIRQSNIPAKSVLIYALTANQSTKDRKRCLEAGMNGVLHKPILENDFLDFLGNIT